MSYRDGRALRALNLCLLLLTGVGVSHAGQPTPRTSTNPPARQASQTVPRTPRFDEHAAARDARATKVPSGYERQPDGWWRDDLGKLVEEPTMNFAGKYHLGLHSCGTGCRYYTLTDLTTGVNLPEINMFDATEPSPRTKDGHPYITRLIGRPDSKMLVAQYLIEMESGEKCRERIFVMKGTKFVPITATADQCGSW